MENLLVWMLGLVPLFLWMLGSFNEWRYCRPVQKSGSKLPPGRMGWPVIGELSDFLWCFKITRKPEDFIRKRMAKYGETGMYRSHLFGFPTIITCSPEANRFVLGTGTEEGSFVNGWPSVELVGKFSFGTVEGQQHKRIRRHVQEAINGPEALRRIFVQVHRRLQSALEDWVSKGSINADLEAKALGFRNTGALLLSWQAGPQLDNMEMLYRGYKAGIRSQAINFPGTAFRYALQCRKKLSAILLSEIRDRKVNKVVKQDFLQSLIDSVNDDGDMLTENEVVDNMLSLILAGYESTASVIMWGLYYLAKYPDVLQKLREENLRIRQQKEGEEKLLRYEDVKSLRYTSKAVDEVIRLANISPFQFRTVARDVDYDGFRIPKGWKVIVWLRSLHVDPQYFQNPLEFNPDRWDGLKPKPGVYQPFGYGPRFCPGSNLARLQLTIFLHYVCVDYKWKLTNPDAGMQFLPNTKPADGGQMTFSRISST